MLGSPASACEGARGSCTLSALAISAARIWGLRTVARISRFTLIICAHLCATWTHRVTGLDGLVEFLTCCPAS